MKFHKILVPADFSPSSLEAFRVAVTLAKQFKAHLILLHVIDKRIMASLSGSGSLKPEVVTAELQKKAKLRLPSFLEACPREVKVSRKIVTGVPFHEIVRTANQQQVDLIVMGRYGGTGELEKILFGSTAEKVVRLAPCAVLSIPRLEAEGRKPFA